MSLSVFDKKIFNGEVFQGYVERIPNPKRNELIKSRAIRPRPELATVLGDHDGGNYMTSAMNGLISGSTVVNYDGQTNITSNNTDTYKHSRVVVGRGGAWTERDFSHDITGGKDFIENIAEQISDFKDELDQDTLIHILNGVFNMADTEGAKFVTAHTTDVTAAPANGDVKAGCIGAATVNTAVQKACGDNKGRFSLVIMHSTVATNLENLKLLSYMKYTDAQGIERDLALATLNGKTVLVDDSMPTITVNLGTQESPDNRTAYITYILGDGAIEYTDCEVKVPYETEREAKVNGGQDTLVMRQRKCFAPYGISFTQASMATLSPTDTELELGANWEIVSTASSTGKKYLAHKMIPIARIISLG